MCIRDSYYLGIYNTPVESSTVDKEYYSQILTYLKRSGSDQTVALNSDVLVNIDLNQVLHLHNSTRQKITVVYKMCIRDRTCRKLRMPKLFKAVILLRRSEDVLLVTFTIPLVRSFLRLV